MMRALLIAALLASGAASAAHAGAPTAADSAAIRQAALDYIESWYEADPDKMERALHPDLAKRIVHTSPEGRSRLDQMSAMTLVQAVRSRKGKKPPEPARKDVTILDIYENIASVKLIATGWVDHLHIARYNGRWVIVNVLWELEPR
jgi:hypothetical protein